MSAPEAPKSEGSAAAGGAEVERIVRNKAGQLDVTVRGRPEPVTDATAARCFPWTLPDGPVSLRDKEGHEVALLKTLAGLDPASRETLETLLREMVLRPRITRVVSERREFGIASLTVETDRGAATFQIRSRDDVRMLSPVHVLFRDPDGNTYEVQDMGALDAASRRMLERNL